MKMTDDLYLLKLKSANVPDDVICRKLNITPEEMNLRLQGMVKNAEHQASNGYAAFCDQFTVLANQYQLVGESLKILAGVIGDPLSFSELQALVTGNREETLK